jgi:hypothetical protein
MVQDKESTIPEVKACPDQALGEVDSSNTVTGEGEAMPAPCEVAPAFAQAAAFAEAVNEGRAPNDEDIYLWEHGVAVEPWPEPVDGKALLDALECMILLFVRLPKWAAETLALWVLHTYAFQLRQVATYIGIESPAKRCGKTTLLTVLCELVNRPVVASNISSPAFFRVIEEKKPTLLIDEADTVLHRNKELHGIFNSGYAKKTAYVIRASNRNGEAGGQKNGGQRSEDGSQRAEVGEQKSDLKKKGKATWLLRFSSWCPKAIATIKHLPETLADRCIVIGMHRKHWSERCERLRTLKGTELRRKCARFVMDHAKEIAEAQPEIPSDLNDRAADIWEPLLALADLAGAGWGKKARDAALGLTAVAEEESPIVTLLLDLWIMFIQQEEAQGNGGPQAAKKKGGTRVFSRDLVAKLNYRTDRPWRALCKGKEVTELWLSQQLRPYGVLPKTMWIGERAAKGYLEDDLVEAVRRYVPKSAVQSMVDEFHAAAQNPAEDEDRSEVGGTVAS